jgi:hypothetical protein
MITANIQGPDGKRLRINEEGAVDVVMHQHPPTADSISALPFRSYFTKDGTATGVRRMDEDGSVTPVDYYIKASPDYDIYIKFVSVEIGDGGTPTLNNFGSLSALTNGVAFYWDTQKEPEYELHEGIITNKMLIRAFGSYGFGNGVEAFLADVSGNNTEKSYFGLLNIEERYGLKFGLRLRKGTNDKIILRVQDDLTGLSTFNAIGTGIRI